MKTGDFFVLVLAVCLSQCKREKPDLCNDSQQTSADFIIEEGVRGLGIFVETDLVSENGFVRFTARHDLEEYYWQIGAEALTGKSVGRAYFPRGKRIPITLVGYRKPNAECFPGDDGWDTVTKYIDVLADDTLSPMLGTYRGVLEEAPEDTFDFIFGLYEFKNCSTCPVIRYDYIENIPIKGRSSDKKGLSASEYKGGRLALFERYSMGYIKGHARLTDANEFILEAEGADSNFIRRKYRFKGVKIR